MSVSAIVALGAVPSAPPTLPSAPLAAFTRGSQVGVPTGTSLTATSGLASPDLTGQTFTRVDPLTGTTITRTGVRKWMNRSWAAALSGTVPSGQVYWFEKCRFATSAASLVFNVEPTGGASRLAPVLIFVDCEFNGGGNSDKAVGMWGGWFERCDLNVINSGSDSGGCEDGIINGSSSTFIDSNLRAGIGPNSDPHADGAQMTDSGGAVFWHSWISGGDMPGSARGNAALRVGTEFGAVNDVGVYYCGFGGNSFNNVQFRGDSGNRAITNVRFRGNRWCTNGAGFVHDFQQSSGGGQMIQEWTDNAFGTVCTINGTTYPAGTAIASPGV